MLYYNISLHLVWVIWLETLTYKANSIKIVQLKNTLLCKYNLDMSPEHKHVRKVRHTSDVSIEEEEERGVGAEPGGSLR